MNNPAEDAEYLRIKLKRWEQKFQDKYHKFPEKKDIDRYPEVGRFSLHRFTSLLNIYVAKHMRRTTIR